MTREEAEKEIRDTFTEVWADGIIKALKQEPILDKIRAEVKELGVYYDNDSFSGNRDAMFKCNEVLQILYKYKAESEEE